jgi:superfamily II DNA or RNA helicase
MTEMIKKYLGPKGYSIRKDCLSIQEQIDLRKDLTVKAFVPKNSMQKTEPFPVYRESKNKFYVPRFFGTERFGYTPHVTISDGDPINLKFKGELRPYQKPIVDTYIKKADEIGGGLLEVAVGFGKTIMALNIISKIKRKTLIVVHKEFLLRQWIERIEEFLPGAKVGRIQGEIVDIAGKDIVIGMLQSLSMKDYPSSLFKSFGLSIYDEVHHLGAEVFSRALFKIVTKRMLGLSATMKRSDNLSKVFKMFIGPIVYTKKREGGDGVVVHAIDYENNDEEFSHVELNFKGHVHYSKMIKKICEFNHRSEFILKVLGKMLKDERCKQIMILGHNKVLLKYLHDAIEDRNMASVGYYVGGMKEKDLKISETKKVVIATYAMASEGLDIKTLSTLIMATPKSSVEQCIGRILRVKHDRPLVVDIVDQHEFFNRQWMKRKRFYVKEKYKIKRTNSKSYFKDDWVTIFDGKKKKKSYKQKVFKPEDLLKGVCLIDDDD